VGNFLTLSSISLLLLSCCYDHQGNDTLKRKDAAAGTREPSREEELLTEIRDSQKA